jgi:multisubunit Na+/H+ antiporter MnhF subunit
MTNFYQAMLSLLVCFVGGVAVLRYLKNFYFPKG